MVQYIKRKDLNIEKYNACIENSIQSKIYAFTWYLDIVADNWDALVLDDYEAVMPVPWRKKYFIKYVYQPLWTLELGVFSKEVVDENEFLIELFDAFRYTDLRMNTQNSFSMFEENRIEKQFQFLSLKTDYQTILKNYNRNRKRELTKAKKNDLIENWNDNPEKLITIFKANIAKRVKGIKSKDFLNLLKLMKVLIDKKAGNLLTIYDTKNNLVAAAFFLKYKGEVIQLVCASDVKNRKNGAHTFFNDRAIFKYQPTFKKYNFGGSSMESIGAYYKTFGAKTIVYQQLKYNNLPKFMRFFKR